MRHTIVFAALTVFLAATTAFAAEPYPTAAADRPLVLNSGMSQASFDYGVGLNKDRAFDDMNANLGFSYGLTDDLELGLDLGLLSYSKDVYDAKLGGANLYGRYKIVDALAAELNVYMPGDRTYLDSFGDQLMGVLVNIPVQAIVIENMLKLRAAAGFDVGFVSDSYATSGGESPQMAIALEYGATYNPLAQLFFDLSFGTRMALAPSDGSLGDRTSIPATLRIGGTMMKSALDLYASVALADLKPAAGEVFDTKSAGLGVLFRF